MLLRPTKQQIYIFFSLHPNSMGYGAMRRLKLFISRILKNMGFDFTLSIRKRETGTLTLAAQPFQCKMVRLRRQNRDNRDLFRDSETIVETWSQFKFKFCPSFVWLRGK